MKRTWIWIVNFRYYGCVCRRLRRVLMDGKEQVEITCREPDATHTMTLTPLLNGRRTETHHFTWGKDFSESHTDSTVRRG
jgi:hypothetical protein